MLAARRPAQIRSGILLGRKSGSAVVDRHRRVCDLAGHGGEPVLQGGAVEDDAAVHVYAEGVGTGLGADDEVFGVPEGL